MSIYTTFQNVLWKIGGLNSLLSASTGYSRFSPHRAECVSWETEFLQRDSIRCKKYSMLTLTITNYFSWRCLVLLDRKDFTQTWMFMFILISTVEYLYKYFIISELVNFRSRIFDFGNYGNILIFSNKKVF